MRGLGENVRGRKKVREVGILWGVFFLGGEGGGGGVREGYSFASVSVAVFHCCYCHIYVR